MALRIFTSFLLILLSVAAAAADSTMRQKLGLRDAAHLLQRTGLGADPHSVREFASMSREDSVERILTSFNQQPSIPMPAWVHQNAPPYWARGDMEQAERRAFNRARNREVAELRRWWVAEMITTPSPQTERLVLLWHNHFVSAYSGIDQESTSIARQNQMFREMGIGNFRDLLRAVLRDPAMLNYLDNRSNKKKSPNENLARELLEIFTMGEGEYDEFTVKEAARALTGWTVSPPSNMSFTVASRDQDQTNKTLFGQTGNFDGDDLIDRILEQPATAKHLARVFWRNFVSEFSVDENIIASWARVFSDNNFELLALYRAVLRSPAFWAEEYRGHIVKSPVDLLIGTIRTTGVVPKRWQALPAELDRLGQALFDPPNVAGWKGGRAWITPDRLLNRRTALQKLFRPASFKRGPGQSGALDKNLSTVNAEGIDDTLGMMTSDTMMSRGASSDMGTSAMAMSGETTSTMLELEANLSVRLASEDYQGSPKARVILRDEAAVVWDSGEFLVPAGHDTEKFGRLSNDDVIPWQRIDFQIPDTVVGFKEIVVEYLNDAAGQNGDRNLFVDMVNVRGKTYLARTGAQRSGCPPENADEAGTLYCAGTVTIPTVEENQSSSWNSQQITIADAYLLWYQKLKKGANRRQMDIGLKDLQLGSRKWDTLVVSLVSSRAHGPGIEISSEGCTGDCFETWPDCAWQNESNVAHRSVFFPVNRHQVDEQLHCHWDSLNSGDQLLVGSLMTLLPDIVSSVSDGRKASRNPERFSSWAKAVNDILVNLDPVYRFDNTATELVVTGYDTATSSPPQLLDLPRAAGRDRLSILNDLGELLSLGGDQVPVMLAVSPVTDLSKVKSVSAIFADPVYQVR